jgi:hypothetical protein
VGRALTRRKLDPPRFASVDGHWLWVGGPVPPGSIGITLGRLVVVRRSATRSPDYAELLAHERVHVRQFAELGATRFLVRYLRSYAHFRLRGYGHNQSYVRIPLEIEARVDARTEMLRSAATRDCHTPSVTVVDVASPVTTTR